MNRKYLSIILTVSIICGIALGSTACKTKQKQQLVKYKSKYSQLGKQQETSNHSSVINLSDGKKANFDYRVGPTELSDPSFNIIKIDNP